MTCASPSPPPLPTLRGEERLEDVRQVLRATPAPLSLTVRQPQRPGPRSGRKGMARRQRQGGQVEGESPPSGMASRAFKTRFINTSGSRATRMYDDPALIVL
ncbi:MAG: hypothetical protein IPO15_27385 [Anaerolineae bacterium]|uniref:hypothetical protein n=1 Tax=Candidatus Amarolinea dominans TaxID=3140696 RepID=UPI00313570D3|nr:hypothetical protein [Anaerolineae bacterium]